MITIAGSVHRSFVFPARRPAAFDYYSDALRIFSILPHISIAEQYSETDFRLAYQTTELGIYRVRLLCDIRIEPDRKNWTLHIRPLRGHPPVSSQVGLYSLQGQADYASDSIFRSAQGKAAGKTEIDYRLRLGAQFSAPLGIRFMPDSVLNGIARSIAEWRMDEIAGGFIDRSILVYSTNHRKAP